MATGRGAGREERPLLVPEDVRALLHPSAIDTLRQLGPQRQESFLWEYRHRCKRVGTAYLWWMLPPILSPHYGYLDRWPLQFVYWLTLGGLGLWWLLDGFRLPRMVREANVVIADRLVREVVVTSRSP